MSPRTSAAGRARSRAKERVEVIAGDAPGRLAEFAAIIERGLTATPKYLPTRWLYDSEGVSLVRELRQQPEYYQVRAECALLESRAYALPLYFSRKAPLVVELGVVDAPRTSRLLAPLIAEFGTLRYVAVGPDREAVGPACTALAAEHPELRATAMVGRLVDAIRELRGTSGPVLLYWPESGLGTYDRPEVTAVLRDVTESMRGSDLLVAGVDLRKDPRLVQRAHRDRSGRGKRLQLNALERINDLLGGHFDLANFRDRVTYDEPAGRLETALVSRRSQTVAIDSLGIEVPFAKGEAIRTMTSTKFSPREIDLAAETVGLLIHERWYDGDGRTCANLMRRRPAQRPIQTRNALAV